MLIPALTWFYLLAWLASFVLGFASLFHSMRPTISKALRLWSLGLVVGIVGVIVSFWVLHLEDEKRAAAIRAGEHLPLRDMAGFGQVLMGIMGLMYFAGLFVLILIAFAASRHFANHSKPKPAAVTTPSPIFKPRPDGRAMPIGDDGQE